MTPDDDDPALYDVARRTAHQFGYAWTDPRTGVTYPPPSHGRVVVRTATDAEQYAAIVRAARQAVRDGAGHECAEWRDDGGACALCGRMLNDDGTWQR